MQTTVLANDDGDLVVDFGYEMLDQLGWKAGDVIRWEDNGDGSFTLTKSAVPTVVVSVETVKLIKNVYHVTVPADHPEYALDSVTCNEVLPTTAEFLSETIVSHRVVTETE